MNLKIAALGFTALTASTIAANIYEQYLTVVPLN